MALKTAIIGCRKGTIVVWEQVTLNDTRAI